MEKLTVEQVLAKKRPLIAAHRGKAGGNIVENTVLSAKCAIMSGADIVEFDVARTRDGETVVFHTGMEHNLFWKLLPISLSCSKLLRKRKFKNVIQDNAGYGINTLDEFLDAAKNKYLINLDRIWKADVNECLKKLRDRDMLEQVIIKTNCDSTGLSTLEKLSKEPKVYYMAICFSKKDLEAAVKKCEELNVRLRGVEIIFRSESDYFCSEEFFERARENGWALWVNAITLNERPDMCAGHGDNASIASEEGNGWDWLIEKGYDIIQTDWAYFVKQRIEALNK